MVCSWEESWLPPWLPGISPGAEEVPSGSLGMIQGNFSPVDFNFRRSFWNRRLWMFQLFPL